MIKRSVVEKLVLVMHNNACFLKQLERYIPNTFTIIEKQKIKSIVQKIRTNQIACMIIHIEQSIPENIHLEQLKKNFSHIPCIAVIASPNVELARYCGSIGIECVLSYEKIHRIKEEMVRICTEKNDKVIMGDLAIDINDSLYSSMISESLSVMERYYPKILNINEIADLLEIDESTLSREYKKANLPSPKKILMHLKIHQAIRLMKSGGLNNREISLLSGFSNEKRMSECFHRMFGMSPGEYRRKNVNLI
jgi:AraC-like DNA-binding protein